MKERVDFNGGGAIDLNRPRRFGEPPLPKNIGPKKRESAGRIFTSSALAHLTGSGGKPVKGLFLCLGRPLPWPPMADSGKSGGGKAIARGNCLGGTSGGNGGKLFAKCPASARGFGAAGEGRRKKSVQFWQLTQRIAKGQRLYLAYSHRPPPVPVLP
jgi:hypothetical protein